MMKTVLMVAFVAAMAIGGGAASVFYALQHTQMTGAMRVGAWTAFPADGTPAADPYSRARSARRGKLALGRAEGLIFTATNDSEGDPLRRQCSYRLVGELPPIRLFTLQAADLDNRLLPAPGQLQAALHSEALIPSKDGRLNVAVGASPAPGNWLATEGEGPMRIILTLFDTPISTSARVDEIDLPVIERVRCDA